MKLLILNHKYQYEILKLTQIFFPNEKITMLYEMLDGGGEPVITTRIKDGCITVQFVSSEQRLEKSALCKTQADEERVMASLLFEILKTVTGDTPKWGMLTGIRPSKLLRSLQEQYGEEAAQRLFTESYFVSPEKTALTASVAAAEEKIIQTSQSNSASLYIAIPFCPSRCSYCSFVSHSMETKTAQQLVPDYVRLLCTELRKTGEIVRGLGLRLETVYFGGGTPTTLEADDLKRLLDAVGENFDLSAVREYTVEAGRPDTITSVKLKALREGGVRRISINPQTFGDNVLQAIGRKHTAALTAEKFEEARAMGFHNINMDLIAGLPQDTAAGFQNSVEKAISFTPENITIHTLALKRASNLGIENAGVEREKGVLADGMLTYAYQALTNAGYFPYYMYRQSKTLGNLENTGYCKPGYECLYNIFMMEECQSVFAAGAGAVTKLRRADTGEISRIFNFKYPYEYISRFEEVIKRKEQVFPFFAK